MRFDDLVSPAVRREMVEIAREFRKEAQPSEALLWQALRSRQVRGFKFRRQQPIGAFIVDFYCDEAALVVEVDGPIHEFQRKADRQRQEVLEDLGLRVLRIPAQQVEHNLGVALARIEHTLQQPVPLSPRERGQG